jgi:hypothetical protein
MAYSLMFRDFSYELANEINAFTCDIQSLSAWAIVTAGLSDVQKMSVGLEFVNNLGTKLLCAPYMLRSRFIFATAHLSHQANRAKHSVAWSDDLPMDGEIYMQEADKYGAKWRRYKTFKRRLETIGGRSFQEKTYDFRNVYNHRFSPRFMFGHTQLVKRVVDKKSSKVTYCIGEIPPLQLDEMAKILVGERGRVYATFEAFQDLVREQEDAIKAF